VAAQNTLSGEIFLAEEGTRTAAHCDAEGTSSFSYLVEGTAAGPVTGTFTETGQVVWGPQEVISVPGGETVGGPLVSLEATFTIRDLEGTPVVTGRKHLLIEQPVSPTEFGGCFVQFNNLFTYARTNSLCYEALFTADEGNKRESGISQLEVISVDPQPSAFFRETFEADPDGKNKCKKKAPKEK
jgi:hypothetical protein